MGSDGLDVRGGRAEFEKRRPLGCSVKIGKYREITKGGV